MAQFDQRWQKVSGSQHNYIVGRDLNFGAVQNPVDFVSELEKLKGEVVRARQESILDKKKATDVEYQITKAAQEAEETRPDKKTILDHLKAAKSLVEGIPAIEGLVTAIVGAIATVQTLFH